MEAECLKTDYIFFLGKQFVRETQHVLTLGRDVYLLITWYLPTCTPLQGFEDFGNVAVHTGYWGLLAIIVISAELSHP